MAQLACYPTYYLSAFQILEKDLQKEEEKSLDERNVWDHEFMVAFVDNMKRTDPGDNVKLERYTSQFVDNERLSCFGLNLHFLPRRCRLNVVTAILPMKATHGSLHLN